MTESQDPGEALSLAADTLGRDILEALLAEIRPHMGFEMLPVVEQEAVIERLRKRTRTIVTEGLGILFRGAFPACEATLDGIRIKSGLHITLKIAKGARNWHEVVEAEGKQVLLVMANPEAYTERMDEVKARANQGDLFSGDYQGNKGYRRDYTPPPPETSWQDVTKEIPPAPPTEPQTPQEGAPVDEPPPPKSMAEQVIDVLAQVHVTVDMETAAKWTERECVVAYHWASTFLKDPDVAPARPWWLPMPQPPNPPVDATADVTEPQTQGTLPSEPSDSPDQEGSDDEKADTDAAA